MGGFVLSLTKGGNFLHTHWLLLSLIWTKCLELDFLQYMKRFIIRIWFMELWRLRSSEICSWQTGNSGESMVQLPVQVQVQKQKTSVLAQRQESKFSLVQLSFSSQAFNRLHKAHPHWGGHFALLSLPIHQLILPRSTLIDTPSIMLNEIFGHPVAQSSWHIRLTITGTCMPTLTFSLSFSLSRSMMGFSALACEYLAA